MPHRLYLDRFLIVTFALGLAIVATSDADDLKVRASGSFEKRIAPILIKRCVECHNSLESSGGLDLTTRKGLLKGGESGEDLSESNIDENYLLDRVRSGEMPPEERGVSRMLPKEEILHLQSWIKSGVNFPEKRKLDLYEFTNEIRGGRDWWSLQPITRPRPPGALNVGNPIDAFIRRSLREKGLIPARPASRSRLFRRIVHDVTGLPPDHEEALAFRNSTDKDPVTRLIDRLLSSPRFGENFARDWLDLVRYADTNGYERDAEKPNAWKFRDYVIDAFNTDKPFDRFVVEQLAGDQLNEPTESELVGTTMLRLGTWDDEPNDKLEYKYDRLEDLVHVTSTAFLGLTVKCARCHNHKFDPIPQTDYYRVASIFWPGDLVGNVDKKIDGYSVFAWTDETTTPAPIHLLKKGDARKPGPIVEPGFISAIPELDHPFQEAATTRGTGRRLAFARRLVDERNPLVARVIANRLWQHYFGFGLVRSSNNFGFKGDLPTHPRLLDFLASEIIRNDWNLKPIHRMILTSATYQQDSIHEQPEKMLQIDPLNRFLWRANRRRLKAEAIRDSLLFQSGELNQQMGGRGFTPVVSREALEGLSRQAGAWSPSRVDQRARRGIYMFQKRSLVPPLFANFDFADTTRPCGKRDSTTVAPQALGLLNNAFVHRQSELFADQIIKRSTSVEQQIQLIWNQVYCRDPEPSEISLASKHYQEQLAYYRRYLSGTPLKKSKSPVIRSDRTQPSLHLDAAQMLHKDKLGRVTGWTDNRNSLTAKPPNSDQAPLFVGNQIDGRPAIQFNGKNQFLKLDQQVIQSSEFTIIVVGHDTNSGGSREFLSNWNRDGNSTSSVFLGLTDGRTVRFSDQFRSGKSVQPDPFILTAVTSSDQLRVYDGRKLIGERNSGLTGRNLKKLPYVIGTQGNFGHEFQKGWLAELLVFNTALSPRELNTVWSILKRKYPSIRMQAGSRTERPIERTPELLALASVCHVLLNSNEMIFLD